MHASLHLIGVSLEQSQCPFTDVMLDAFGVSFSRLGIKAEADQEAQDNLVPAAAFMSQGTPLLRQKDRAVSFAGDESLPGQPVQCLGHRWRAHTQARSDGNRPGLSVLVDELGNKFDVIFRQFVAPCAAHFLKGLGATVGGTGFISGFS